MKKNVILASLFLSTASLFACGKETNAKPVQEKKSHPELYGTWHLNLSEKQSNVNGFKFAIDITIEENKVTNTTYCTYGKQSLKAYASSPIQIADNEIQVLESSEKSVIHDGMTCSATIDKGTLSYRFENDKLYLKSKDTQDEEISATKSN